MTTARGKIRSEPDPAASACVTEAFLKMHTFNLAALQRVYNGT